MLNFRASNCVCQICQFIVLALFVTGGAGAQSAYPGAGHGGNYMHNYYFPPAPSSTPWAPAWSPDGDQIAVALDGSIWVVDVADGAARELTSDSRYHSMPAWSPDGEWIVYTSEDGTATMELHAVRVSTGATRRLTDDAFLYTDPAFSPDGNLLAYVSTKPSGYFNVYVRPIANGSWAGDEIAVTGDNDFGTSRLYFGRWDMHIAPAWLPGGTELLLVSNRDQALGSGNVLRVPARADGIAHARPVLREQTLYRTRPDVSLDGKRFVYSSTSGTADQFNNLYVQPTEGGEPYKLTFFDYDAFHPRWSPDGEWIAYIANRGGLPHLALLETYGGAQRDVTIGKRTWSRPVGTLSLTVHDEETGDATPARVLLQASDGRFYAPDDAYARVGWAGDHLFHTTGQFDVTVPAGPVTIIAMKGFEFRPDTLQIEVAPQQTTSGVISLTRLTDLSDRGWFNGSTHVHMNYAGNLHNTPENMLMMAAAEDMDIVNEQIANKDNRIIDYQFFVPGGGAHPTSLPDRVFVVGQEYRPPFYGHVFMLGLRDHLISPFVTGYEGTAIESLYPSNTDMLRKAKAQGATVGYVHPFSGDADPLEGNLGGGKGFMMDAALGTTDALEWSVAERAGFFPLYAAWNNGLRITAVGGEDSISDLQRSKLVGSIRTYVCTESGALTARGWYAALRAGRAFVSNGPLVEMTVGPNNTTPGGTVNLPVDGDAFTVRASIRSIAPIRRIFLVANGSVVDEVAPSNPYDVTYTAQIRVSTSGWIHLRAEGDEVDRFPLDAGYPQAFTNPVWIDVGGQPVRDRDAAAYGTRWIDKLEELAAAWPGWRSDAERLSVFGQFDEARDVYAGLADEATGSLDPATLIESSTSTSQRPAEACRWN
jgi:hypothetical protein